MPWNGAAEMPGESVSAGPFEAAFAAAIVPVSEVAFEAAGKAAAVPADEAGSAAASVPAFPVPDTARSTVLNCTVEAARSKLPEIVSAAKVSVRRSGVSIANSGSEPGTPRPSGGVPRATKPAKRSSVPVNRRPAPTTARVASVTRPGRSWDRCRRCAARGRASRRPWRLRCGRCQGLPVGNRRHKRDRFSADF